MRLFESKQAVILAGGEGTRLRSRIGNFPKPLAPIGGSPLLSHQLELLRANGFQHVLLLVNYGARHLEEFCRSREDRGLEITILHDGVARGTAGAVLQARHYLEPRFAVLYGDTMLNVDLNRFWEQHANSAVTSATLFLHPNDHPYDSDLVEVDEENRILEFHRCPHPRNAYLPNLVNAALYMLEREALEGFEPGEIPLDFAKHLFPRMLERGLTLRGYNSAEYIKDVGTPDRLDRANRDFKSGLVARASLREPQRAVLIDRDGTLNEDRGHISSAEQLHLFDFAGPALRKLNENEWRAIAVTNQPVVARGEATIADLRRIHNKLETELARSGAYLDAIYICPHHPDGGFPGEVTELKKSCECRKPAAGLILRAKKERNLDLTASWLVGDSTADIAAGEAAGVTTVLVRTGLGGRDRRYPCCPDFVVENFAAAVDLIVDLYPRIAQLCGSLIEQIQPGSPWFFGSSAAELADLVAGIVACELRRSGLSCIRRNVHETTAISLDCGPQEQKGDILICSGPGALQLAAERNLPACAVLIEGDSDTHPHKAAHVIRIGDWFKTELEMTTGALR